MELTAAEGRVLGCLMEKAATVPDSYPLTLNSLRLACNQTSGRNPVVAYDDRTVEDTLLALKSKGLARFVHAGSGARSTRYGHKADERWHLGAVDLAALSILLLRGPQTTAEVRSRAERYLTGQPDVEASLDLLAARTPSPFAVRLARRPGERETRWAQVLAEGPVVVGGALPTDGPVEVGDDWARDAEPSVAPVEIEALTARMSAVEDRLEDIGPGSPSALSPGSGVSRGDPGSATAEPTIGATPGPGASSLAAVEARLSAIEGQLGRIEKLLGDLL